MKSRIAVLALGALCAGNALTAGAFSVYFNGESPSANCHVDNASNAQLSTSGNGNLVVTAPSPLIFSSACGVSGSGQQLTFGPAQPLLGPAAPLAAGTNVAGNFTVLPLNATSCTVTYTGAGAPPGANVCGAGGAPSCSTSTPIAFSANFTNTGTNAVSYQATVTCQAAVGASPSSLQSSVNVSQNGNSGGTPSADFTCTQTSSLTIGCTDQSSDPGGSIGSWSWDFGDGGTSTQTNPSHVYASVGTKSVTLIVTDSVNPSNTSTKTKSVSVTAGGATACTTGQTGDISGYTALCSGYMYRFLPTQTKVGPSPYTFDFVFGSAWPGDRFGLTELFNLGQTQFLSIPFTPSPAHTITIGANTTYMPENNAVFSVSTQPGLFNSGVANGTTVLCVQKKNPNLIITSNNNSQAQCKLNPGQTYWLNMLPGIIFNGVFTGCQSSNCVIAPIQSSQTN